MDYCVTLLLEHFDETILEAPPSVDTAWGRAVRAEDVGTVRWRRGSVVIRLSPPFGYIVDMAPQEWGDIPWRCLSVKNFLWREERLTPQVRHDLVEFVAEVLPRSGRWCVCIEKHCDEIAHTIQTDLDGTLGMFRDLLGGGGTAAGGVFCYGETL